MAHSYYEDPMHRRPHGMLGVGQAPRRSTVADLADGVDNPRDGMDRPA